MHPRPYRLINCKKLIISYNPYPYTVGFGGIQYNFWMHDPAHRGPPKAIATWPESTDNPGAHIGTVGWMCSWRDEVAGKDGGPSTLRPQQGPNGSCWWVTRQHGWRMRSHELNAGLRLPISVDCYNVLGVVTKHTLLWVKLISMIQYDHFFGIIIHGSTKKTRHWRGIDDVKIRLSRFTLATRKAERRLNARKLLSLPMEGSGSLDAVELKSPRRTVEEVVFFNYIFVSHHSEW